MNEIRVVGSIDKVQSNLDFYLSVSSIDRKLSIEQYRRNLFEKHFEDAKLHLSEDIDELKAQIIEKTKELEERKKQEVDSKLRQEKIEEEKERVRREREERKRVVEERRKREELIEKDKEDKDNEESRRHYDHERRKSEIKKEGLKRQRNSRSQIDFVNELRKGSSEKGNASKDSESVMDKLDSKELEKEKDSVSSEQTTTDSKSEDVNPVIGGSIWDEMFNDEVDNTSSEEEPVQTREFVSTGKSFLDSVRNKECKGSIEDTKEQSSSVKEVSEQGNEECEYVKNGSFLEDMILEEPDEDSEEVESDEVESEGIEDSEEDEPDEVDTENTQDQEVGVTNENVSETTSEEIEYVEHGNFLEDLVQDELEEDSSENEEYDKDSDDFENIDDYEDTDEPDSYSEDDYDEELPSIDEEESYKTADDMPEESEDDEPEGLFEDEESETVDISEKKADSKIIPMVKKEVSMEDDGMYAQNLPRDVRDFLKLHPNSDMSYVLKFYPKKEIDKQIRLGKIFTRKGKLMI